MVPSRKKKGRKKEKKKEPKNQHFPAKPLKRLNLLWNEESDQEIIPMFQPNRKTFKCPQTKMNLFFNSKKKKHFQQNSVQLKTSRAQNQNYRIQFNFNPYYYLARYDTSICRKGQDPTFISPLLKKINEKTL